MQQPTDKSVGQRKHVSGQYLDIALVEGNIRYIALLWPLICPRIVMFWCILHI